MSTSSRPLILKKFLQNPANIRRISIPRRSAALTVHFFLGFLCGSISLYGRMNPFGVAITARSGGGLAGFLCAAGAAAGYFLSAGAVGSIRYIAALVLVYTTSFIFRDTPFGRKRLFISITASVLLGACSALCWVDRLRQLNVIVPVLTESIMCGIGAALFAAALDSSEEEIYGNTRSGSILLLCCLLMAICRLELFGALNIGRFSAVLALMVAAYTGGAVHGSTAGVILGTAVDLAAGGMPFYTVCYGVSGLLAGSICKRGRLLFQLCFLCSNAVMYFWQWTGSGTASALYEGFAASIVFMLLPASALSSASAILNVPSLGAGEAEMRRYTALRAHLMADAFRELYETVRRNAESLSNDTDIATVYDRAAETVCAGCTEKGICWHRDYVDTLSALNDTAATMRAKGYLEREDLPLYFLDKCTDPDSFIAAVNTELRALIYRRRLRMRLEENRCVAYGQFRYLAGVLDAVSEDLKNASGPDTDTEKRILRYLNSRDMDAKVSVFRDHSRRLHIHVESARLGFLYREPDYMDRLSALAGRRMCRPASANQEDGRMVLLEAEPLAVSVGVAAMKKEGEPVSGDRGTYFKTEQGVLCVLLSDGMGSGEQAARESISVVRILERFLRSGVEPATAMKILNSVMLLKNGENWGYATVDLMCIDLFTGQTGFYKYGAAPSYIRLGKTVRRVKGISMAAGILSGDGEPPDVVRMHLRPGGVALIVSDGVACRQDDGWIRTMLAEFDGLDTREFARSVIRAASDQYGHSDDMTVLVVKVEERK